MNKRFELWLDESGCFSDEAKLRDEGKYPSLVGGILIRKSLVETIDFNTLIDSSRNHANTLSESDKKDYVLPVLEELARIGAIEVFFENVNYKDAETSRELYLQILTEGVIQLASRLDAEYESVDLEVLIAQRQDVEASANNQRINESEYIDEIQTRFARKKQLNRLVYDDDSSVSFKIVPAHESAKIQCADFACNTRLTRDSGAFDAVRQRVSELHNNALFFTLSERPTINIVKQRLTKNNISGAILELYTTLEIISKEDRSDIAKIIISRMKSLSFRMLKSQLRQCSSDIIAYAQSQDDYEQLEDIIKKIDSEIITKMKKANLPFESFRFTLLLWLSNAYLREGDIVLARETIMELDKLEATMGNSIEELMNYCNVLEKKALLCIDEFNYPMACEYAENARKIYESFIDAFSGINSHLDRFSDFRSEYLGDAICMELFAKLFMLREKPELYERMIILSDKALTQYPNYPGELQRNYQYRSRIEAEHGNYRLALNYLYKAVEYNESDINKHTLRKFLNTICEKEQTVGCRFFLMYYMYILTEAKLVDDPIADEMYKELQSQKRLLEYGDIKLTNATELMHDVDTSKVSSHGSGIKYHPIEIILWKYATYNMLVENYNTAEVFYKKAIDVCKTPNSYLSMNIISLGIMAELGYLYTKNGKEKEAKNIIAEAVSLSKSIKTNNISKETAEYIDKLVSVINSAILDSNKVDKDALWKASRIIAY